MKPLGMILISVLLIISLTTGPILAGTAVAAAAAVSCSQQDEIRAEKRECNMLEIFKQLNLSPEQDRQLKEHRSKHQRQKDELERRIWAKKRELKQELQKADLDLERINRLHSEFKTLLGEREDQRLEAILEVRKILTPRQLERFLQLIGKDYHGSAGKEERERE
ncbi:MAG: periplasmic heavy metal sensor [bacterium]|nr:periplasmic heavy metal sensor [bacterium]